MNQRTHFLFFRKDAAGWFPHIKTKSSFFQQKHDRTRLIVTVKKNAVDPEERVQKQVICLSFCLLVFFFHILAVDALILYLWMSNLLLHKELF